MAPRIWRARCGRTGPLLPGGMVTDLPVEYAGETRADKLRRLRTHMEAQNEAYWILASLDAIAWLFNIRGRMSAIHRLYMRMRVLAVQVRRCS